MDWMGRDGMDGCVNGWMHQHDFLLPLYLVTKRTNSVLHQEEYCDMAVKDAVSK